MTVPVFPVSDPAPSLHRLAGVFDDLACVLFRRELGPDGRLTYPMVSPTLSRLVGHLVLQEGTSDLVHPADRPGLQEAIETSARHLTLCREQFRVVTANGETRWLRGASEPQRLPDGRIAWEGAWIDISAWMRADYEFKTLSEHPEEALFVLDQADQIIWGNTEAQHLFGHSLEGLRGRPFASLFRGGLPDLSACSLPGTERSGEGLAEREDAAPLLFRYSVRDVAVGDHGTRIVAGHDAQRAAPSDDAPPSPFSSDSDWFWETDARDCLTFASEQIGGVLGVKPSALVGHSWFEIGLDDTPEFALILRTCIEARIRFRDLVFSVGPPGGRDRRTLRLSGLPIFTPDGFYCGYRGIGTDITREVMAEHRAQRAHQQLVDAIESFTGAIAVYDPDDRLFICNPAYSQSFDPMGVFVKPGASFEQILHECHHRHVFDLGAVDFETWLADRLRRHHKADGEAFIVKLTDGRWMLSRECAMHGGGVVSIRTDITELKQREQDLDDLRRRYEVILDSAGEGIVGLDAAGRVNFANRMAGTILGRTPDAMTGMVFHDLINPDAPASSPLPTSAFGSGREPPFSTPLREACHSTVTAQVSTEIRRASDGCLIPVDFFVAPVAKDNGRAGNVLVFRDATERLRFERSREEQQRELERQVSVRTAELKGEIIVRRRVEGALRQSRERLKAMTDSLFEGVLVMDSQGQISFANPSARQLLACGEVEGHPLDSVLGIRTLQGDLPFVDSPLRRVLETGVTVRDDDAVFTTPAGAVLDVAYACSPLGEDGARRSAVLSFRDIQSLKRAQRELFQASRLSSVGQLAAGIAHEINTPVQYIGDNLRFIDEALGTVFTAIEEARTLSQALAQAGTNGAALEAAREALSSTIDRSNFSFLGAEVPVAVRESLDGVEQIARIVLSMKDFSHPGTSTKTMTDLNRALESTLTVSRNVWKHAATIVRAFQADLPPVLCHAGEMNQVFLNLIVNAVHAIEASGKPLPGTITVTTSTDGPFVEVRVTDTGTGIPEEIRERLFDPFFTTKEVGKGTGQGLAICRDVVATKHGGTLEAGGEPGQGAVFTVRLPVDGTPTDHEDS
ncbi:PAS domain S-box protein [Pararhodospirillum oryzae]|nr:PAS domain S-box protein [Pararhodospirillum oryzae]